MSSPMIHAMLVHFPIVLLLLGTLLLGLEVVGKPTGRFASWILGAGVAAGGMALLSGGQAEETAEHTFNISERLIETHETWAYITVGLFVAALGLQLFARRSEKRALAAFALVAALTGSGALAYTGHLGGDMVYGETTTAAHQTGGGEKGERGEGAKGQQAEGGNRGAAPGNDNDD